MTSTNAERICWCSISLIHTRHEKIITASGCGSQIAQVHTLAGDHPFFSPAGPTAMAGKYQVMPSEAFIPFKALGLYRWGIYCLLFITSIDTFITFVLDFGTIEEVLSAVACFDHDLVEITFSHFCFSLNGVSPYTNTVSPFLRLVVLHTPTCGCQRCAGGRRWPVTYFASLGTRGFDA